MPRSWKLPPWGAAGRRTPRGGGFAILLNPACEPQFPGCPPSCHVCLPGGKLDVARPGPMPVPSWAIPPAV